LRGGRHGNRQRSHCSCPSSSIVAVAFSGNPATDGNSNGTIGPGKPGSIPNNSGAFDYSPAFITELAERASAR